MTKWAKMREEYAPLYTEYGRAIGPFLDRRVIGYVESDEMPIEAGFVFRRATDAELQFYESAALGVLIDGLEMPAV